VGKERKFLWADCKWGHIKFFPSLCLSFFVVLNYLLPQFWDGLLTSLCLQT
jgi:hypothetical protein